MSGTRAPEPPPGRADAVAAEGQGAQRTFARALEKLIRANNSLMVTVRATTHPDPYDRLLAAGYQPPYPRPAPPGRRRLALGIVLTFPLLLILNVGLVIAVVFPGHSFNAL